eukprot:5037906-Prymnesium_polylepis.3
MCINVRRIAPESEPQIVRSSACVGHLPSNTRAAFRAQEWLPSQRRTVAAAGLPGFGTARASHHEKAHFERQPGPSTTVMCPHRVGIEVAGARVAPHTLRFLCSNSPKTVTASRSDPFLFIMPHFPLADDEPEMYLMNPKKTFNGGGIRGND